MQVKQKVVVIMGGWSAERSVSLESGMGVLNALKSRGVDAHAFDLGHDALSKLQEEQYTQAFITAHGRYGEDGCLQGLLEIMHIPYSGSGVLASSMAMNKETTKRLWSSFNLSTPQFRMLSQDTDFDAVVEELGLPLMVKPAREGSSYGLTKVTEKSALKAAYDKAAELDSAVMVEEYIIGDELTCAMIENVDGTVQALPLIRIVPKTGSFDFESKYLRDDTEFHIPCGLSDAMEREIQTLALAAYKTLGCRGWARADVMLDKNRNKPFLLEMNTAPGMTSHSLVPMAAKAAGLSYEDLVIKVLATARNDHQLNNSL